MAEENIDGGLQDINEQLYKQNLELAVRNKILSLLRELYQISILTLEPAQLANQVAVLVQKALELELVAIYGYSSETDIFSPLGQARSERLDKELTQIARLTLANQDFRQVLAKETVMTAGLINLWGEGVGDKVKTIEQTCHIRSSLIFPLTIENRVLAGLIISLNRPYEEISQFEKESIVNIVNIIAVALDRALLDQQLKSANNKLWVANDKLQELDRMKTEFVSLATHQLRSPLTAIKGYSSMILENSFGPIEDKARGAVDVIFQSSQKLVKVIEDFLNITRIELGTMKYEQSEFDFKELVENVSRELKVTVEKKGLQFSFEIEPTGNYKLVGDSGKLAQVVGNLIDNAIKYTPKGWIKVSLNQVDGKIRLTVTDSGVGMPAEVIPKLFQKFTRADDAGQVNITGTGLGLYVAKQIVDGHHGKIWAESDGVGQGSRFVVELN
ncbi:MAG: GAF domain-containing sensor histidine kinase [Candidatus Vogelbacteria bacterium]